MEIKPLPKVALNQRLIGIIVCFFLFSFIFGLAESLFKSQLDRLGYAINNLITMGINFVLLLMSMAVIKSKSQFEKGDWTKVAWKLIVLNFILSTLGLFAGTTSIYWLYRFAGYGPVANEPITTLIIHWLVSCIEMVVVIFLASFIVLRKPNAEPVSELAKMPPQQPQ